MHNREKMYKKIIKGPITSYCIAVYMQNLISFTHLMRGDSVCNYTVSLRCVTLRLLLLH